MIAATAVAACTARYVGERAASIDNQVEALRRSSERGVGIKIPAPFRATRTRSHNTRPAAALSG